MISSCQTVANTFCPESRIQIQYQINFKGLYALPVEVATWTR